MGKIKRRIISGGKIKNHSDVNVSLKIEKNHGRGVKEIVKEKERPADQTNRPVKSNPANMLCEGNAIVGLTKGVTLNMGNYQSAKIDVSVTRVCRDDEHSIMDNLADISIILDEQLEYEQDKLKEE